MQTQNLHHESHATPINSSSIIMRLADNIDLLTTLAEVMTEMQVYASLSSLSMINREYHALLGPHLKKTKAMIVIDLSS